ncbi:MAG: ATP-binding protein [Coriobacteriales bacterium]|jgi:AAA+ ATPase superfamily predicted ATPase|nr:ATP-binding protein [Coriobacteriales bacterium]
MHFVNRVNELKTLTATLQRSKQNAQFTLVTGRRRVGKTALLLEHLKGIEGKTLYLYVARKSETLLVVDFQQAAEAELGLKIFGTLTSFSDYFEQLLIYAQQEHLTLVLDEFQDFDRVNKSIFGSIQNLWDRYKDSAHINLIVSGSIYALMVKLFEDDKEPLFGRLTSKLILQPFTTEIIKSVLYDYNPTCNSEDLLFLYALSGGSPRYLALLIDAEATDRASMLSYIASNGSPFLSDGKDILVSEFGKDYATYFSILQLIASGKTSQSAIDLIIGKTTGAYLQNLEKDYSLIAPQRPLFAKPQSRTVKWRIIDRYLVFWFRFVFANQGLIEMGRFDLLQQSIEQHYSTFSGLALEDYFRAKLAEEGRYTRIGASWDNKGLAEIDILALNDLDKTALVAEVKRNAKKINLAALRVKADSLTNELAAYEVSYQGFSMADM